MHGTALRRSNSLSLAISGVLLLALAGIFFVLTLVGASLPGKNELIAIEGAVEQIRPASFGKSSVPIRFRLNGDARVFQYISKSGDIGRVETELAESRGAPVRILVDPDDRFATVLEIETNGRTIRSYDAIAAAWRRDDRLGAWIACSCALVGLAVIVRARWRA
jgi:hypothetical protein